MIDAARRRREKFRLYVLDRGRRIAGLTAQEGVDALGAGWPWHHRIDRYVGAARQLRSHRAHKKTCTEPGFKSRDQLANGRWRASVSICDLVAARD